MSAIGSLIERMRSGLGRLRRDTRGMVLVYISIALAVFMGGAALVIDGGRIFTLQTELQSAADAFALAGAAELDGLSDSITRANRAIDTLVQNEQSFASGAAGVTVASRRYLDSLPDDGAAITADFETTDPAAARYVEVVVQTRSIDNFFAQIIGGGDTTATTARAVAGFTQAVCQFTPLYICSPFSDVHSLAALETKLDDPTVRRRLYQLWFVGNSATTEAGPGNFGLLEAPNGPGANALRETLAKVSPNVCYTSDGVNMKQGEVASIRHAINVRFDIYEGGMNSDKNDSNYRPALNVTKGYTGTGCSMDPDPAAKALPVDNCFGDPADDSDDACTDASGRLGDGDWDVAGYWAVNHPTISYPPADRAGWGATNADRPSRYEVYRWEIEGWLTDEDHIPGSISGEGGPEEGRPQCSGATPSDDPDRRILYVAVMDCDGSIHGGSGGPYKPLGFAKMFLTRPVENGSAGQTTIWAELIDIVKPGEDDAVVRDIVQLYR